MQLDLEIDFVDVYSGNPQNAQIITDKNINDLDSAVDLILEMSEKSQKN